MCLAVPMRIESIEGSTGVVDMYGVRRQVSLVLTPEARVGDYALIHTGFAISVLDPEAAQETLDLLSEMAEAGESSSEPEATS